jgi:hypothetical protein
MLVFLICIFLGGCIPLYYTPNAPNVPLFEQKNDALLSGAFRFSAFSIGCDFQAAHAITNHIGWMAGYNHWSGRWRAEGSGSYDYVDANKGDLFEFGLGYYTLITDKISFETYGGIGWIWTKNEYESKAITGVRGNRYFVQPAIGFHLNHVDLGVSVRFAGVNFTKFTYSQGANNKQDIINLQNDPFSMFAEPAFTMRVGGEYIRFQLQVLASFPLNNSFIEYDPFSISTGLVFLLKEKKKVD